MGSRVDTRLMLAFRIGHSLDIFHYGLGRTGMDWIAAGGIEECSSNEHNEFSIPNF